MSEVFDVAHAFTARWEGGLSDHPADPGGITNYGVSLRFLQDYAQNQDNYEFLEGIGLVLPVMPDTIRRLTREHARAIYRRAFWDAPGFGELPRLASIVTFDAAVNSGAKQAVKFLQRACNAFDGEKLAVDGAMGAKTRARAREIAVRESPDRALAERCVDERDGFYRGLVESTPSNGPFLKGWLNRTKALRSLIQTTEYPA